MCVLWLVHHKSALKDIVDTGSGKILRDKIHTGDKLHKELIADIDMKRLRDTVIKQTPEIPPKSPKELVEVPGQVESPDPVEALADRLSRLETAVHRHRQSFIRPSERPEVG